MNRIIVIILCVLVPFFGFAQGKVTRGNTNKTTQQTKRNGSSQKKTKKTNTSTTTTTTATTTPTTPITTTQPTETPKPTTSSSNNNSVYLLPYNANVVSYFVSDGVTIEMVKVSGDNYEIGSNDDSSEKPIVKPYITSFEIGRTEVTQKLWTAVMGSNPSTFRGDRLPVENISWEDCQAFIKKLNSLTGKKFRLPKEFEWECAARGDKKTKSYKYSGSNSIAEVAWYSDNANERTHEVATKSPNALGIYDMSGNVWEWTAEKWCPNYSSARTGPGYVIRGGGWEDGAKSGRVSTRYHADPKDKSSDIGFRLAL